MKKTIVFSLLIFSLLIAYSQALHVFEKGKDKPVLLLHEEIDSITTLVKDSNPQHVFYTKDNLYTYNIADIDSIAFNLPYIVIPTEVFLPKNYSYFTMNVKHNSINPIEISEDVLPDWLLLDGQNSDSYSHKFFFLAYHNELEEDKKAYIYLQTEKGIEPVKITHSNICAFKDDYYNNHHRDDYGAYDQLTHWEQKKTHSWKKGIHQIKINEPFSFSHFWSEVPYDWIRYDVSEDKRTITLEIDENHLDSFREAKLTPTLIPEIYLDDDIISIKQHPVNVSTPAVQKEALIELYNAMGGADWEDHYRGRKYDNWLSEKPLREWGGLRVGMTEDVEILEVYGAKGELPACLAKIMDVADIIIINGHQIYLIPTITGKIPKELTQHPRWDNFGWRLLADNRLAGMGIDMDGINLRVEDHSVMLLDSTTTSFHEILSKNKYTLIATGLPTDEMANVFLSYCNKGFGYFYLIPDSPHAIDEVKSNIKKASQYPLKNISPGLNWSIYSNNKIGYGLRAAGSTFILDSVGNVIDFVEHVFDYPSKGTQNSYYANRIDSILHNLLGEPEPHDPFVTTYYTSTDYSKDGEVLTLQKATVGNGIDLVFTGDMYVDTLLVDGGQFEKDMKASMEYFFEVEPYRSLRERFNVYAIKAVSPMGYEGSNHKFSGNKNSVLNFVQKIPNIDINNVTISVINYNPNYSFFASSSTCIYESGATISFIEEGGPSRMITRMVGGIGFGRLLDESITRGYDDNYCPPENLESFKQWIKTEYHDRGWGMNVDATNAPDGVVWSHFLQDSRYAGEVGIYQGAWMWPYDLWRPSENSIMNTGNNFNAPSREAIYKRIMQLSEGDDWVYDYETFVEWDAINRQQTKETKSVQIPTQSVGESVIVSRTENHRMPMIIKGSPLNPQGEVELPDFIERQSMKIEKSRGKVYSIQR